MNTTGYASADATSTFNKETGNLHPKLPTCYRSEHTQIKCPLWSRITRSLVTYTEIANFWCIYAIIACH